MNGTVFVGYFVIFDFFEAFVCYFLSHFYFAPNDSPSKTMKNVFSFRSRDIQIFVFLSPPLFLPVSHCIRGCSKINLKVYDLINCLNKNLNFQKEKSYSIETLSMDRVLNEEHFYGKIIQKMCTKS